MSILIPSDGLFLEMNSYSIRDEVWSVGEAEDPQFMIRRFGDEWLQEYSVDLFD